MKRGRWTRALALPVLLALAGLLSFQGCYPEQGPPHSRAALDSGDAAAEGAASEGGTQPGTVVCHPARAEAIPARIEAMSDVAPAPTITVVTKDLYRLFVSSCGVCHVATNAGGFDDKVTLQNFASLVDDAAPDAILSDDPNKVMPPLGSGGKLHKDRLPGDPFLQLAAQLKAWIQSGKPSETFDMPNPNASRDTQYILSKQVGTQMTNLGNCIPEPEGFGSEQTESKRLDELFATASTLPATLNETDLVSFDSAILARYGVVAFAPGYPLWSDNARKIRHVRVPRGSSIVFHGDSQQRFSIPDNTRFYKTFLKQVTDTDGNVAYRKMETRLIVVRQDECDASNHCTSNSLMGTYRWDDETHANLVTTPLNDQQPFADTFITYDTDEPKANAARAAGTSAAAYGRSYAIPGSTRCAQCHMGSISHSGILGFMPLQILRRPQGEGGVIEPAGADELDQLERLISYGVISGIDSPGDVKKLEDSQAQAPRNEYELTAQGYMLGNCAHCHNEHGFASVKNPELRDLLNFLPHRAERGDVVGGFTHPGGIFQFPLGRTSPRIFRGIHGDVALPYITPSLYDIVPRPDEIIPPPGITSKIYTDKTTFVAGQFSAVAVKAPWRSLIYRNVDTPFGYSEDYAIFPHMPKNTAGYDCRAPRIMAEWMTSIVSTLRTDITGFITDIPPDRSSGQAGGDPNSPQPSQPYREVKAPPSCTADTEPLLCASPDYCIDQGNNPCPKGQQTGCVCRFQKITYQKALDAARQRVDDYHHGHRYDFCPDTSDILDPAVVAGLEQIPQDDGYYPPTYPVSKVQDGVPDRAHWFPLDLTEASGSWLPRRGDWSTFLLDEDPGKVAKLDPDKQEVLAVLGSGVARLSADFRSFALSPLPLAYWDQKAGTCSDVLDSQLHPADFQGQQRMRWLSTATDAPIYSAGPGAAVFTQICRNCHGPLADGHSTLADTVSDLTGGNTRVANLHDGLFGPPDKPGSYRVDVFGDKANNFDMSSDDLAARYLAWMALGGTEKIIPDPILIAVSNTLVFGQKRGGTPPAPSANMLAAARQHCGDFVQPGMFFRLLATGQHPETGVFDGVNNDPTQNGSATPNSLLWRTGDAELWERICSYNNPFPGVLRLNIVTSKKDKSSWDNPDPSFTTDGLGFTRAAYPASSAVGGAGRVVQGLTDSVTFPWCLSRESGGHPELADQFAQSHAIGGVPLPICPSLPATGTLDLLAKPAAITDWTIRGAATAGMSVFVYLDGLARHKLSPTPLYNECEQLRTLQQNGGAQDGGTSP